MKRNRVVKKTFIFALLLCWIGIAFYGWRQTQEDSSSGLQTIIIGYQAGDEFDISQERGKLVKKMKAQGYKVKFKEFQNGSAEMQALASGSIDYARIGDTPGVTALAAGTDLTYVAVGGKKDQGSGILVHNDSGIDSATDLAGKKIAYTQGTSSQYLVMKALQAAGLTTDDVELVNLDQSAASVAYADGTVDAWANWDPATSQAEVTGNSKLVVTGADIDDNNRSYIVAATDFAEDNQEATELLIEYTNDDMEWANNHHDKLITMMAESLGVSEDVVTKMVNRRTYSMSAMTSESVSELQDIADMFYDEGLIENQVTVSDHVQYVGE